MLQIKIPKPCHEDWNAMTPTSRGAFCNACAKDVVDFTRMTDEEVQLYLLNKAGDKVCGKFNNTQLHRIRINIPNHIFYAKIAGWKKFMAVVLLAFGSMLFGCDVATESPTTGIIAKKKDTATTQLLGDTIAVSPVVGEMAIYNCQTTKGAPAMIEIGETMGFTVPIITGDIELKPDTAPPPIIEVSKMSHIDTTLTKKVIKDSLFTLKHTISDSTDCKTVQFY